MMTDEAEAAFLADKESRPDTRAKLPAKKAAALAGGGARLTNVGGFRRVGPVGASSTLAACVGFGVLFALLVMLRAMVWKLRQTENRKGNKPMTNNNRKMFAACTLDTIWGVGTGAVARYAGEEPLDDGSRIAT